MKVVFILNSLANIGGVERMLVDKANHLATNGWNVIFVTYEQGVHPILYKLHSSLKHIDLECRYYELYRYSLARRLLCYTRLKILFRKRLYAILQEHQTQLVVTTTYSGEFLADILAVCRPNVKTIVESHTAYAHDMIPRCWREKLTLFFKLRNIRRYDLLIALTENDANSWRQQGVKVKVVPNHVAFFPETLANGVREEGRIIAIGRLHHQKRFDRLIDAFSLLSHRYPKWHLDIYGRGADREMLLKQIEGYRLTDRIIIHEPVEDVFCEYQRSQFFVLSSDYEGFGLVIVESMACGTPVVSTDCPYGPAEIIEDGVTGLLCQMDVHDLASKMEWMILHDSERGEMGAAAHKSAAKYKKDRILCMWTEVYQSISEKKENI